MAPPLPTETLWVAARAAGRATVPKLKRTRAEASFIVGDREIEESLNDK